MRARWTILLGVVATGLSLPACGDGTPDAERLAEDLVTQSDGALDEDQATCVAEGLEAAFGDDAYRDLLDAAEVDDLADADVPDDVRVRVIDIFSDCDALGAVVLDQP